MADHSNSTNGDDPKIVEFPKAEIPPEERARRLQAEVERQARLPLFERVLYLEDAAKTHGIKPAKFKALVEAIVRENEKKAREAKTDNRYERRRVEQKQEREGKRTRQDEKDARKEAERERKEAERIEREQEAKRKKRDAVFAEIADLPKLTHEVRLKEAAKRLELPSSNPGDRGR